MAGVVPNDGSRFVALDFETADGGRDSACAIGLVTVDNGIVADREELLIRPPRRAFTLSHIHDITWRDVRDAPTFAELWPRIAERISGAEYLAAHNAAFDSSVLRACCRASGISPPHIGFLCTLQLAKAAWSLSRAALPEVCFHLGVPLDHHHAASDAEACARIVLAAADRGFPVRSLIRLPVNDLLEHEERMSESLEQPTDPVVTQLDDLATLRSDRDALAEEKEEAIARVYTPAIRAQVEAIEEAFAAHTSDLDAQIRDLEAAIKEAVLARGTTVKGHAIQAMWMKGRVSWDTKALDSFAQSNPAVLKYRKVGEPFITLRGLGGGTRAAG